MRPTTIYLEVEMQKNFAMLFLNGRCIARYDRQRDAHLAAVVIKETLEKGGATVRIEEI